MWLQPLDVICSCHARADLDEDDNDDTATADCLPVQLDPGCGGIREHERRQLHGVPPPFVLTDVSYFAHSNLLSSLDDVLPSIEIFGSTYSLIAAALSISLLPSSYHIPSCRSLVGTLVTD